MSLGDAIGGHASNIASHLQDLSDHADLMAGTHGRDSEEAAAALRAYLAVLHGVAAARSGRDETARRGTAQIERLRKARMSPEQLRRTQARPRQAPTATAA